MPTFASSPDSLDVGYLDAQRQSRPPKPALPWQGLVSVITANDTAATQKNPPLGTQHLEEQLRVAFRNHGQGVGRPRQLTPARGRGGGGGVTEAKIEVAAQSLDDLSGQSQEAIDFFNANGPFLLMRPMKIDEGSGAYVVDFTVEIYVRPGGGHTVDEFLASDGSQIFGATAEEPTFTVSRAQRGATLLFGEGEVWVDEPDPEEICEEPPP